jgi:hypothetical protein
MSISTTKRDQLDKSMKAAQNVDGSNGLGTLLKAWQVKIDKLSSAGASGSHLVSEAEMNASLVIIETGETGIVGHFVEHYTSGSQNSFLYVENTGSNLNIGAGSGSALTVNDEIYWKTI